jgi:hypothetical protein
MRNPEAIEGLMAPDGEGPQLEDADEDDWASAKAGRAARKAMAVFMLKADRTGRTAYE